MRHQMTPPEILGENGSLCYTRGTGVRFSLDKAKARRLSREVFRVTLSCIICDCDDADGGVEPEMEDFERRSSSRSAATRDLS